MIRAWRGAGPTLRWLIVLGAALVAVLAGSAPARAGTPASAGAAASPNVTPCTNPDPTKCFGPTTSTTRAPAPAPSAPTTTAPSATTTTTPAASAPAGGSGPDQALLIPCGPPSGPSRACTATPSQVAVSYPTGQQPPAVDMAWVRGSDPAAPQPASPDVTLDPKDAVACQGAPPAPDRAEVCWSWPAGLMDRSWILNGTYQLTPAGQKAIGAGVAVPPAPPRQVVAAAGTGQVKISWQPSATPEPDLVGYAVIRDGQPVYYCSTDGMGPGAPTPCASPLSVTDHPGAGTWTYTVSALRLGVDDASGDAVGSAPAAAASGPVEVSAPPGPSHVAALSPAGLAPLSTPAATYSASGPTRSALPGEGGAAAPGAAAVQNLQYPGSDRPVPGAASDLALRAGGSGPRPDVVPAAVLALALIALAIAAHFLYLRVQLGLAEARMADRRRRGQQPPTR